MTYIAICDDNPEVLQLVSSRIEQEFELERQRCKIVCFPSAKKLEEDIAGGHAYDVFFLDIDMPGGDGISLSKRLKARFSSALIVFVTSHKEYVFTSFQVEPFRFIRKSRFSQEIRETVQALCKRLSVCEEDFFVIDDGRSILRLKVSDLLYVEGSRQLILLVTEKETLSAKYKMMDAERELVPLGFIRIHRSYLVNFHYVHSIEEDSLRLDNGERLPISRYRMNEVKEEFLRLSRDSRKA